LREKASKGRRFGPDKLQKEKKKGEEKERRRKKATVALSVFI